MSVVKISQKGRSDREWEDCLPVVNEVPVPSTLFPEIYLQGCFKPLVSISPNDRQVSPAPSLAAPSRFSVVVLFCFVL